MLYDLHPKLAALYWSLVHEPELHAALIRDFLGPVADVSHAVDILVHILSALDAMPRNCVDRYDADKFRTAALAVIERTRPAPKAG